MKATAREEKKFKRSNENYRFILYIRVNKERAERTQWNPSTSILNSCGKLDVYKNTTTTQTTTTTTRAKDDDYDVEDNTTATAIEAI